MFIISFSKPIENHTTEEPDCNGQSTRNGAVHSWRKVGADEIGAADTQQGSYPNRREEEQEIEDVHYVVPSPVLKVFSGLIEKLPRCRAVEMPHAHSGNRGGLEVGGVHRDGRVAAPAIHVMRDAAALLAS